MFDTEGFVNHFRRQREWTRRLIEAIPETHFDWRPADTEFSCGDLVRHMIQAEIFWRRLVQHGERGEAYDPFELEGSVDERMAQFRRPNLKASRNERFGTSFAECLETWEKVERDTLSKLAALPEDALAQRRLRHPLTGLEGSLAEMLLIMIEHEAHHRGQLSAYLKVIGVPQPATFGR